MPAPLLIPLIAAAAGLAGSGINAASQAATNRRSRQHEINMLNLQNGINIGNWHTQNKYNEDRWNVQNQYNEGLWNKQNEYNEKLWHMMNDYNSPMSQMARFKEAGLNPNLIYGQSNTAGGISTAQFQSDKQSIADMATARPQGWNPRAPQFDVNTGIMAYNAFRESSARINNLEEQNKILVQEQALKSVETAGKAIDNSRGQFELDKARSLLGVSLDAAAENLRKTKIEADVMLNRDERERAMNASNLREAAERIMHSRGQRVNQSLDAELKEMDIQLRRLGVMPGDNLFFRVLGRALEKYGAPVKKLGGKMAEFYLGSPDK